MKYNYTSVHDTLWKDAQDILFHFRLNLQFINSQSVLCLQQEVFFCLFLEKYLQLFQAADIQKSSPDSSQNSFKEARFSSLSPPPPIWLR